MSAHPFYFTWSWQPGDELFPVKSAAHDEFLLEDGRRVYDFISTSFQANFGHSNSVIVESIHEQLDRMPIASPKASFELKREVSERLIARLGLPHGKLFYTVSGSESVENALKMARQVSGRTIILARKKSYHGASLGALSVTGDWRNEPHFTVAEQTVRIPEPDHDPDLSRTRQLIAETGAEQIAGVIVETVSDTNGVVIPGRRWFDEVRAICDEHDIFLIIDEVLCGFGRTGPDFAFQRYELEPDFVCMSKGITGGYVPFGAVWTGSRVVDYYQREKMVCGLTNYAHPLGLAALSGVLDLLADPEFQRNKGELEAAFGRALDQLASFECVNQVRRCGLLAAVDLVNRPAPSWETCFASGLHLYSKDRTTILAPPLVSEPARLVAALDVFQGLLKEAVTGG